MVNIEEIRERVRKEGKKIKAPSSLLSVASRPRGDGSPHVELSENRYHYVISERGVELARKSTSELDELLFWIFSDIVSSMAQEKCSASRRMVDEDPRRCLFQERLWLLGKISKKWVANEEKNIEMTLKVSPMDDYVNIRAEYCKSLISQGEQAEMAYQKALEEYPEPKSPS